MTRHRTRQGEGTAWLVADQPNDGYYCYWYGGRNDGHLLEHVHVASTRDALAWGRMRTTRVRIRTAARTYWAGTAPRPDGFSRSWTDTDEPAVAGNALAGGSSC